MDARNGHLYLGLWLLVALQVLVPAGYYLRANDPDDERFAWRMFSNVRFKRCEVSVSARSADGEVRAERISSTLHSSWVHNLERGRMRVIERYLATRCDQADAVQVRLNRACRGVTAREHAMQSFTMDCTSGDFRQETP